ncbi:hypothetical protein NQD34_007342 [Periophthalmus magnuspinnatus]|nr:hypothetical protein NQD34_007342 [Periophthalmus magnuspinnatus]
MLSPSSLSLPTLFSLSPLPPSSRSLSPRSVPLFSSTSFSLPHSLFAPAFLSNLHLYPSPSLPAFLPLYPTTTTAPSLSPSLSSPPACLSSLNSTRQSLSPFTEIIGIMV